MFFVSLTIESSTRPTPQCPTHPTRPSNLAAPAGTTVTGSTLRSVGTRTVEGGTMDWRLELKWPFWDGENVTLFGMVKWPQWPPRGLKKIAFWITWPKIHVFMMHVLYVSFCGDSTKLIFVSAKGTVRNHIIFLYFAPKQLVFFSCVRIRDAKPFPRTLPKIASWDGVHFAIRIPSSLMILLMEAILHHVIGSWSHYLQGFFIPGGAGFLPSTVLLKRFIETCPESVDEITLPETNSPSHWKWMVGRRSFFFGFRPISRDKPLVLPFHLNPGIWWYWWWSGCQQSTILWNQPGAQRAPWWWHRGSKSIST